MIDGVVLLWFVLTALALLFVVYDIRTTPESPVLKWGFVLLTACTGVFGAFLYVLGCREPLPHTHTSSMSRLVGDRCLDRPCTVLPATVSASLRAP
jgi:hypothetical protein